jgi:uncharacterized membrane protein YiaA
MMKKFTNKHLKIIGWIILLIGVVVYLFLLRYYHAHPEVLHQNGKWIVVAIFFIGAFFFMPWIKEKKEENQP